jgi:hypothetical protein
MYLSLEGVMVH